ncbi:hypothetical protein ETAA8_55730 [Anatilimnocola aggregata]|uniref:Lipoprotein n=1 Tax=Anatilimnocola aggregata TaxID=2528021 RepID=A0A517YJN1_9BACT|nr:hypothetical protein [Anatilimnocola aggregata]QDU30433.1 hypothetical protein ETAA8_55730 [Anatilimnocola aggregata]
MNQFLRPSEWPWAAALLFLLWLGTGIGCGNKQLEELAAKAQEGLDQAKQTASDAAKQAEEGMKQAEQGLKQLPSAVSSVTAGEIKLTLDAPVNCSICSAHFTPPTNGRAGLLQIGTSVTTGPQSFPAVYLHAPTDAATLPALVGQTVYGKLFVAKSEANGHYESTISNPVAVQVMKIEKNVLTCQLQNAELVNLEQQATVPVAGTLVGAIRP